MTSLDAMPAPSGRLNVLAIAARHLAVTISDNCEDVTGAWLSLEASGLATPYQTLGWQVAALAHLHAGQRPCIISLRDTGGRTLALFPLVLSGRAGVRTASFPGGKHANYNMGLFDPAAAMALKASDLTALLKSAARQAGIDLYDFRNQPHSWNGIANPLASLAHQRSPSSAWRADLSHDPDAFVRGLMSSESRKKLRHKERKLGDFGPVTYTEAGSPAEARGLLDVFLAQKRLRFAALGMANPFDDAAVRHFLDAAGVVPLADGPPAPLSLFALRAGGRVLAVFGGIVHAGRFSGMFTSFDPDPAVAKHSPGDLLLLHLVRTMCERGLTAFDLGAGEAAYKNDYCAVEEPLFDSFLSVTLQGRALAMALSTGMRAKTALKAGRTGIRPALRAVRAWQDKVRPWRPPQPSDRR